MEPALAGRSSGCRTAQGDNLQVARLRLKPGRELYAEAGRMVYKTANVERLRALRGGGRAAKSALPLTGRGFRRASDAGNLRFRRIEVRGNRGRRNGFCETSLRQHLKRVLHLIAVEARPDHAGAAGSPEFSKRTV